VQDVIAESEKVKKLKSQLNESETKRGLQRKEIDSLKSDIKVLKEKSQPELLNELHKMFYDEPGLMDAKTLEKISEKVGRDLETLVSRYNTIIKSAAESGEPVPLAAYVITRPDMKLVPVRIFVDFDKRKIELSLWEKKLTKN
jgi:hypothetical protein